MEHNRTCLSCGKVFFDYRKRKYCSRVCWYASHQAKYVTLQCARCGKSFQRLKWYTMTSPQGNKFCSKECSSKGKSSNGKRNAAYDFITREFLEDIYHKQNKKILEIAQLHSVPYHIIHDRIKVFGLQKGKNPYKNYKTLAYGKYEGKCAVCKWAEGRCDIHHIIERKDGGTNDISNLILLCPNHHRLWHEGKLKIESELT